MEGNGNHFLTAVKRFISQNELLDKDKRYLVAFSGGADSTAMLVALSKLGYKLSAAHCNFKLRGEESDRDEDFCKETCNGLGVDIHIAHFDTRDYAKLHKVSIEMAARTLRYNYFQSLCHDLNCDGVCVAHHRDDSVETILLNIVRGTGINGLTGIKPKNGKILRPLLCVGRSDILEFLSSIGQEYVTDSTNLIADVQRNKVRLEVLPLLRKLNASVDGNIMKMSEHLVEAVKIIDSAVAEEKKNCIEQFGDDGVSVNIDAMSSTPSPRYLLWNTLKRYGFNSSQIDEMLRSAETMQGKFWSTPTYEASVGRGRIEITKRNSLRFKPFTIPEDGCYILSDGRKLHVETIAKTSNFMPSKTRNIITIDAAKAPFPLTLRLHAASDRFIPFGMKGWKLVGDLLTDRKTSLFERRSQLVMTDGNDKIIWVVGVRTDNRCAVTDSTQTILKIEID